MDAQLIKAIRTGFLAGLLVAVTVANIYDYNMLWACAIGLVGGAVVGLIVGLIRKLIKK